ncbi:hypothetical protein B0A48_09007 [Cryoendolithus antarcticus]|uniref:DUF654-domain-containing protein n=1 Tax=Cryoendolithus antarcticus TaxID=1507870 RepID=A0A1V8T1N6_9PEZI|nr:hypothetical protein B0A48_09007 [Cryoendolithus antarcticus]
MSSRALRKAQREREGLAQLEGQDHDTCAKEDEDDDVVALPPPKPSAFTLLGDEDEGDDDEDESADVGGVAVSAPRESPVPARSTSKPKKKKKKGGKGVGQDGNAAKVNGIDEIDEALKQLSTSGNSAGETIAGVDASASEACKLLAIDMSHLHAQNEMRRLFGRAALDQEDEDGPAAPNPGGNRRQQRRGQQMGLAQALRGQRAQGGRAGGLSAIGLRRNIFIQGKGEWPVSTSGGLGMEVVEKRKDGAVEYRYVHNGAYQDVQSQFESCVASMDPNRLVVLLQHNPYHISTLLQVSEIAKQERDHTTSGDLLERALFSFGRAVHSTFSKNLAEGKARLDFRRPENREFWLASWRYMQNLSMRATWRTVYEWAKLLLSLSPDDDPYAMWLVLDQYAIRSQQSLDYLNISRNKTLKSAHDDMPNVVLSQGLAEYRGGNKSKGKQALFTAIGRFPWVIARLMQELNLQPPPGVWGKEPRTDREKLYTDLYAIRAKDLWNTPDFSALLTEIASALPLDTPSADPDTADITLNEARQVLVSDQPALIALIPRAYTSQLTSSSDPLPPPNSITSYQTSAIALTRQTQPDFTSATSNLRELQGLYTFFADLFPWFNPSGTDGAAPQPSEEEIERRIQASGVSEDVIVERTQRMMELQRQLIGDVHDDGDDGFPGGLVGDVEAANQIRQRQAMVEDDDSD